MPMTKDRQFAERAYTAAKDLYDKLKECEGGIPKVPPPARVRDWPAGGLLSYHHEYNYPGPDEIARLAAALDECREKKRAKEAEEEETEEAGRVAVALMSLREVLASMRRSIEDMTEVVKTMNERVERLLEEEKK